MTSTVSTAEDDAGILDEYGLADVSFDDYWPAYDVIRRLSLYCRRKL